MARNSVSPTLKVHIILIVLLLILIGLVGYIYFMKTDIANQMIQSASPTKIVYTSFACDDKKTIQAIFFNQKVELTLSDERNMLLLQGLSASGTRYTNTDESFTFWNKGNTAFVEEGKNSNITFANCVVITQ